MKLNNFKIWKQENHCWNASISVKYLNNKVLVTYVLGVKLFENVHGYIKSLVPWH